MRRVRRSTTPPIFFPWKENGRCDRPKERRLHCKRVARRAAMLADCTAHSAAEPRLKLLYDLPLLLLPAVAQPLAALLPYGCGTPLAGAALPILQKCAVISVYRGTTQCGERSNAVFRRQSAAKQTSLAPHESKARLRVVTKRRGSWRSHVHRTLTAQRVQSFKRPTANVGGRGGRPSSFSGGFKGGILFEKRIPPLPRAPRQAGPPIQRLRRCKTHAPLSGAKKGAFYGTYNESHCQNPL